MENKGSEQFNSQDLNLDQELIQKFSNILTERSDLGSASLAAAASHQSNNDNVCK